MLLVAKINNGPMRDNENDEGLQCTKATLWTSAVLFEKFALLG